MENFGFTTTGRLNTAKESIISVKVIRLAGSLGAFKGEKLSCASAGEMQYVPNFGPFVFS